MSQGWLQIAVFMAVLVALTKPVGLYMAKVFGGERVFLSPALAPVERLTYRALLVEVWGVEYEDDLQVLRAHVANLRRKIEPPDGPHYIRTDPGVGYRFAA